MREPAHFPRLVRFATFEVDLSAGELRKSGLKLKLTGQPFQLLAMLLERPGEIVTREELQERLWPDTFVDADHNLNTAINKIREVLGDSAENPHFVETVPRRGYRFIAATEAKQTIPLSEASGFPGKVLQSWHRSAAIGFVLLLIVAALGVFIYLRTHAASSTSPKQRALTRLTFDDGLQFGSTWSPDSRFIAYSSNRGGKFDIWVQQISGGDPVQVTKGPDHNWQPDWSPDGKYIAYRSEERDGGLFVIPSLGGEGMARKVAAFGYCPRWSPDGSQILFQTSQLAGLSRFFVVGLDGSAPREVLKALTSDGEAHGISAAWHPDGKRITAWVQDDKFAPAPSFWTAPVTGGAVIKSEVPTEVANQIVEVASDRESAGWTEDFKFTWASSGKAIYFERTFQGATNIWRMTVNAQTLQVTGIDRVTTGAELDTGLALSPDGSKLAFTSKSHQIRAWVIPFDATHGRITGPAKPVTSSGIEAWLHDLSRDGTKLVFCGNRAGRWEPRATTLSDGKEAPILSNDSYVRDLPQWSRDGRYLAFERERLPDEHQLMVWSSLTHEEEPLTPSSQNYREVWDWSSDGKGVLISQESSETKRTEIWLLPVAAPHTDEAARRIASDSAYDLYQSRFSPDGRWIVFGALRAQPAAVESELYVIPASGGRWIPVTQGKHWDDKPRWSPDGKTIYFISGRNGFLNVWGVRFDPDKGMPIGEPFQVTTFNGPGLMIPDQITRVGLSLNQDQLALTLEQRSGSIWVLDNVGQ